MQRSLTVGLLAILLLLAGGTGSALGFMAGTRHALPLSTFTTVQDTQAGEAAVRLLRIRNGMLVGETHGAVRLFLGQDAIPTGTGGTFQFPAGPLLRPEVVIQVPSGMHFVASKKGKKYYPVNSSSAQSIVPENRVYFATTQAAEAAGFRP